MKKAFAIVLIALIALSGVFAGGSNEDSGKTEI